MARFDDARTGVYTGSGGPLTTIADDSGPLNFSVFENVAANAAGTVVFGADRDAGPDAVFTTNGGPLALIAELSGTLSSYGSIQAGDINASGQVALYVDHLNGNKAIYAGSGGRAL